MNILKIVSSALILTAAVGRPLQAAGEEPEAAPVPPRLRLAVEYSNHAACVYVARSKGWFAREGLKVEAYESHVTGMALSAALARGEINAAYICLVPAINAYANAGVPIKIVAATHRDGYGLVVDPEKVKDIRDLEKPGVRIGCVREGGAVDVVARKLFEVRKLDRNSILARTLRMNPAQMVLSLKAGRLDAAFLPEHYATVAEALGFKMLLESGEVWPGMPGSVLVVRRQLLDKHPETVEKLVKVSREAAGWIDENPGEAAEIVAGVFRPGGESAFLPQAAREAGKLNPSAEVMARSMARLDYRDDLDPFEVQAVIDYLASLGYITENFPAEEILDLRFLQ